MALLSVVRLLFDGYAPTLPIFSAGCDFEKALHARLREVEREILGSVMSAADVEADAIEIAGQVHGRVLRCSQTYMTAARPVIFGMLRAPFGVPLIVSATRVVEAVDAVADRSNAAASSGRLPTMIGEARAVDEDEIIIEARAGAALAMMSASHTTPSEAATSEVHADVVDWHARRDSNP